MSAVLIYLLKVAIVQTLLWACYWLLLRRDTFYRMVRWYFVGGISLSYIAPLIPISLPAPPPPEAAVTAEAFPALINYLPDLSLSQLPQQTLSAVSSLSVTDYLAIIALIGGLFMLVRFMLQCVALTRLKTIECNEINGYKVMRLEGQVKPFSFGKRIYLNPEQYNSHELNEIISHELVHVIQRHSVDIVLGALNKCLCWWSPAAWLLSHSLRNNLEYIVDNEMLRQGFDRKHYQYHLLQISQLAYSNSIANHFNFSNLKKRIIMMNKKPSHPFHKAKWLLLAPVALVLLLAFNTGNASATYTNNKTTTKAPLVVIDGEEALFNQIDNKNMSSMSILIHGAATDKYGERGEYGVLEIETDEQNSNNPATNQAITETNGDYNSLLTKKLAQVNQCRQQLQKVRKDKNTAQARKVVRDLLKYTDEIEAEINNFSAQLTNPAKQNAAGTPAQQMDGINNRLDRLTRAVKVAQQPGKTIREQSIATILDESATANTLLAYNNTDEIAETAFANAYTNVLSPAFENAISATVTEAVNSALNKVNPQEPEKGTTAANYNAILAEKLEKVKQYRSQLEESKKKEKSAEKTAVINEQLKALEQFESELKNYSTEVIKYAKNAEEDMKKSIKQSEFEINNSKLELLAMKANCTNPDSLQMIEQGLQAMEQAIGQMKSVEKQFSPENIEKMLSQLLSGIDTQLDMFMKQGKLIEKAYQQQAKAIEEQKKNMVQMEQTMKDRLKVTTDAEQRKIIEEQLKQIEAAKKELNKAQKQFEEA